MTLVDALKKNKPLRRPIPKHLGSGGDGWLDPEYVFNLLICGQVRSIQYFDGWVNDIKPILIHKEDMLADDWELKENG